MKKLLCFIIFWSLHISIYAQANIWYVNHAAAGSNSGQSWANAFSDVHFALDKAQSGDAVWVATGTYYPDSTGNRDRSFVLKSGVKFYGGFKGTEMALNDRDVQAFPVMLSGNIGNPLDSTDNAYTILYMAYPDTSTCVDGFIFQGGFAKNDTNFYTDVPVSSGGAVFIMAQNGKALPVFANCIFRNNTARFNGGAVYVQGQSTQGSTPIFKNCAFINNKSRLGGAIYLKGGNAYDRGIEFDHCRFEGNYAEAQGGCVYFYNIFGNETIDFLGCVVTKNNCTSYGSFFEFFKTGSNPFSARIDSCDIFSNQPDASYLILVQSLALEYKTNLVVSNSIFTDNKMDAPLAAGTGIISIENFGTGDSLIVINNIFKNNESLYSIYCGCDFCFYDNNLLINGAGFFLGGKNVTFSNNILSNYMRAGVSKAPSVNSSCVIKNNIFHKERTLVALNTGNYKNDSFIKDSMHIFNNLFWGNETAIRQYWYTYDSLAFFNILSNNIFIENKKIILQNNPQTGEPGNNYAYFSHNLMDQLCDTLSDRVICGPGNILSSDPLFIDTAALNFHLQPCSPALNKGDNTLLSLLGILKDLEGNPRIVEGTVDIGPYESAGFALSDPPTILPACANSSGGAITLNPANGCEPYTYQWLPSAGNGPEISGLPPGNYSYTVTDGIGRSIADTLNIAAAPSPQVNIQGSNVNCGNGAGGSAVALGSSGTPPYNYLWNTGSMNNQLSMLPAGTYAVSVSDANGCQSVGGLKLSLEGNITLMVDGQPISCFGAADAMLSAMPVTGAAPFSYQWSPINSMEPHLDDLGPGVYTVTATDFYGCTATFSFTLSDPPVLQASATAMPTSSTQNPNGSATAIPSGGTPGHTYAWSNGGNAQSITSLAQGTYTVTITDAHNCTATATTEVKFLSAAFDLPDVQVRVWPNPMTDRLELQALGLPTGKYQFVLQDALGREVASSAVLDGRAVLWVGDLPGGAYAWKIVIAEFGVRSSEWLRAWHWVLK